MGIKRRWRSPSYTSRGLYQYQPIYYTPTTSHDNLISNNYIRDIGLNHSDEGGIYTLSKSPRTVIEYNVILQDLAIGLYFDEGSRNYTARNNVVNATVWLAENFAGDDDIDLTGYQTIVDNYVSQNNSLDVGTTPEGDYIANNTLLDPTLPYPKGAQEIVDGAGYMA